MESLMRLSGVLPEDDDGSTDLATIEKRLADRAGQYSQTAEAETPGIRPSEERRPSSVQLTQKSADTPVQPGLPSPRSGTTSPEPQRQSSGEDKEEDTLAEMMCSLVTNNYGETRYIGRWNHSGVRLRDTDRAPRIIVRIFHLLAQRYIMGQRQDRRQVVPKYDIYRRH